MHERVRGDDATNSVVGCDRFPVLVGKTGGPTDGHVVPPEWPPILFAQVRKETRAAPYQDRSESEIDLISLVETRCNRTLLARGMPALLGILHCGMKK